MGTACFVTLTLAAAGATGLLPATPSAGVPTTAVPSSPTITRSAHIAYLNCPAPDVLLTGSIQRRPFLTGQPVTYKVSIHDLSPQPCGGPNGITRPANPVNPAAGLLGPCGELPVTVDNSRGEQVYPGQIVPSCPMIVGPPLAAGQAITTTGSWDPSVESDGLGRPGFAPGVPRGHYHVVIDGKVTLPVDLAGPPFVSPPATLPPRRNPLPTPTAPFQPLPNLPAPTAPSQRVTPPATNPTAPSTPTAPTAPTRPPPPPGHRVTRSAHVAFDGCAAKNLTLTVSVSTGSGTSVPVRYDVVVHNNGSTPCGAAFRSDPAARRFRVGPCSSMPATFVDAFGVDVYPGPQVYMCPEFAGPYIAPHAAITATATWSGAEYVATPGGTESRPAPPGAYKLVVDKAVEVPFTLPALP
jgi:hypothetical protein